jgi:cyclopropane-fatty-acyl-phospholipid synthase
VAPDARAVRRLCSTPASPWASCTCRASWSRSAKLHDLLGVLILNQEAGDPGLGRWLELGRRAVQRLPVRTAPARIAAHYELDGRIFDLFLDAGRTYTCAYFPTGAETLEEAQLLKQRHVARKLPSGPARAGGAGDRLRLGRPRPAAGARARRARHRHHARARAARFLSIARRGGRAVDRVRFEIMDYRAWTRPVDRVISVGMVEAVGLPHLPGYFSTIRGALREDGVAVVHGIGRAHGPGATNPWLRKYVFPGGYSPALSEVTVAVERSGLWLTDLEIWRLHYARTLAEWRRRFALNRDAVAALRDERFCRMFEFYLSGCEWAFRVAGHMVWQAQLARRPTRCRCRATTCCAPGRRPRREASAHAFHECERAGRGAQAQRQQGRVVRAVVEGARRREVREADHHDAVRAAALHRVTSPPRIRNSPPKRATTGATPPRYSA